MVDLLHRKVAGEAVQIIKGLDAQLRQTEGRESANDVVSMKF